MLKIVEKAFTNNPVRIFAKPGVQLIEGYVCALVNYDDYLVADICSPDQTPFGIIGETKKIKADNSLFDVNSLIPVWSQRMIFKTNNFEHSNYDFGDKLYVGESGMLTNEPVVDESSFVARLTSFPDDGRDYYEALWL